MQPERTSPRPWPSDDGSADERPTHRCGTAIPLTDFAASFAIIACSQGRAHHARTSFAMAALGRAAAAGRAHEVARLTATIADAISCTELIDRSGPAA